MSTLQPTVPTPAALPKLRPVAWLRPLLKHPSGAFGFFGVMFFILLSFVGPLVIPPTKANPSKQYLAPSPTNILGTDNQGKDIFTQIVYGGAPVITVALIAGLIKTAVAITLGALAAYLGGVVDRVINGVANFILTIPYLVAVTVLASFIRLNSPVLLAFLIAAFAWPVLMRTVRAQVLSLREREYIEAARALNLGTFHIIFREILPNMASYIAISMILAMTNAIYAQIALITLGLVPFSDQNWGIMIFKARTLGAINTARTAMYILAPVLAIALFQWSLVTLARSIEDVFNPRLRTGA